MDPRLWLVLGLLIGGVVATAYGHTVTDEVVRDDPVSDAGIRARHA
jgi:hypothetical protein